MYLYEKKDISNKAQSIRNKPLKNSNLPGIQLEKLLNKSTFIQIIIDFFKSNKY